MTAVLEEHPQHDHRNSLELPGVIVVPNFITDKEALTLIEGIDSLKWDISQSGRRKQVNVSSAPEEYK